MKNILIPIDFSEVSANALEYAVDLTERNGARLLIHHSFETFIDASDPTKEDYNMAKDRSDNEMKAFLDKELGEDRKGLDVIELSLLGGISKTVQEQAEFNKVDLIVMGTEGAGALDRFLEGSNTVEVLKKVDCPILVIPVEAKYRELKEILFASDLHFVEHDDALNPLRHISSLYQSQITMLHVAKEKWHTYEEALEGNREAFALGSEVIRDEVELESGTIHDKILDYMNDRPNKFDCLAMIARDHNWFEKMIGKSETQAMAFEALVPVLIMPE